MQLVTKYTSICVHVDLHKANWPLLEVVSSYATAQGARHEHKNTHTQTTYINSYIQSLAELEQKGHGPP
jgi:hypothetical protein